MVESTLVGRRMAVGSDGGNGADQAYSGSAPIAPPHSRPGVRIAGATAVCLLGWFTVWASRAGAAELAPLRATVGPATATVWAIRSAKSGAPPERAEAKPVVAMMRQPDAPRSPVVQPVPLPPPSEPVAPGGQGNSVNPPSYGDTGIPPIGSLTINILPKEGQVPREVDPTKTLEREFGATEFRREPLNYSYMWESPAFFNRPLYFEQPNLERYGYDWGIGQFWISGAQFFVKIPLLPYMMVVHPPREPVYSLGYYRPGSRAPYQINWPEVRLDASIIEGAFITGLVFLIP